MSAQSFPWQDVLVCSTCSSKKVHVPTLLSNVEQEVKGKVAAFKRTAEADLLMPVTVPQLACVQGILDGMHERIDSALHSSLSYAKMNVASQLEWCHGDVEFVPKPTPSAASAANKDAEQVRAKEAKEAKEAWITHLQIESSHLKIKERQYLELAMDRKENVGISSECCEAWQVLDRLIEKLEQPTMSPGAMDEIWKEGDYVEEEDD